jgi:hypothetical protein
MPKKIVVLAAVIDETPYRVHVKPYVLGETVDVQDTVVRFRSDLSDVGIVDGSLLATVISDDMIMSVARDIEWEDSVKEMADGHVEPDAGGPG